MENFTYIILSMGWDGMPIAYRLKQEGCTVIVGQVDSKTELTLEDDEKPEEHEARMKQYDGMIDKMPARTLIDALKKVPNKDEYFIFCDQNNLFVYAQELLDAGFTHGLFPSEQDYEFEKDREAAMQFVKENYPDVKIIPHEEFKTVAEAIAYLKGTKKVYVLQSKGDHVATMVPTTDDPDKERQQMIDQLEKNKKEYEQGEIILKEKLIHPVEITPQIIFYNGKPIFTDLDIETKNLGDGENNGNQVGCGTNLIIKTDESDKLNRIAFPPVVHEMGAARTGMFVWDISLYITPDGLYFGEFCSNRMGYDASMTEMTMAGGARKFFEALMEGENPLEDPFGVSVRLFNLNRQADREVIWDEEIDPYVWMYEVYKKDGKILSLGNCWDLGVLTCSGEKIEEAVCELYEHAEQLSFKELYKKTEHDFLDTYPTSIIFRYMAVNHILFDAPDYTPPDPNLEYQKKMMAYENQIKSLTDEQHKQLSEIKQELYSIINADETEQI